MSFFQGLFSSTTSTFTTTTTTTTTHNQKSQSNIKHHHHHRKQPSLSLRSNLTLPPPSRRQLEKEDEEVYGPPSPHPSPPLSSKPRINSHQTFQPASRSNQSSRSPSLSSSSPTHLNKPTISRSTTDELFLSEHYPPIQSKLYPFFNERLSSPIGMGQGELIITDSKKLSSNHNLQSIWNRIHKFLSKSNPDLIETLSYPVDSLSLLNLESVLQSYHLSLPNSVKDSLQTHDGQDLFSTTSSTNHGLVYGLWLMSSEEIETEYGFWRRLDNGQLPNDAFNATDFARPNQAHLQSHPNLLQNQMSSCPAGWVHEVYSHPGWLPLLTDRVGNYIGVDLSPPMVLDPDHDLNPSLNSKRIIGGGQGNSQASVGQVIAFGREIDEKVVLWNGDGQEGWGKWLSSFADDLEQGNFAILGGTHHHHHSLKNSKRSASNEINQDDESGWKVESDEDEEDGIGELGYFHDGNLQSDWKDSSESKLWKLSNQFRGMNVIEALCERSKQRWSEIGLYSSSATRPNPTHRQKPSLQAHSRPGPSNPNPTQSPHQHPPPGFASGSHASLPSQPDTPIAFVTPPSPRPSTDQLRPDLSTSTNLNVMNPSNKPVRKRTIPPAPASLSLPTMDDMIKDEIEEDEEGIGLSSSTTSSIGNGNHQVHSQENSLGRLSALGLRNELEFGSELESIGMRMIKLDEMKIQNEV